ncbi:hypothetical protein HDU86_007191 [Geranomyces michiganensis]|nr:hypothetical protein HDU86_007191 [Geranomyces michiganensis]
MASQALPAPDPKTATANLFAALQPVPWVPFTIPTAHTTAPLPVLVKCLFTPTAYTVLLTDLERVWIEHATAETIDRKLKIYARSFSATPLGKMLPVLEGIVKVQDTSVKYTGVFEPDETGDLKLHATGPVGPLTLRWVYELTQLTTIPTPSTAIILPHAGGVLRAQVLAPVLAVAAEQARRIDLLYAALEKAERDVRACWDVIGFHERLPRSKLGGSGA